MQFWLFGLFVVLPIVELAVIIKVGGVIGVWPTISLLLLAAFVGSWLMRRQGAAALTDLQRSFRDLRDPTEPIAHGALILLAGALMIAPGFLTDVFGIALLIPAVRRLIMRSVRSHVRVTRSGFGFPQPDAAPAWDEPPRRGADGHPVIDAEFIEIDAGESRPPRGRPSGWTQP
ncbi:FxsA family protein [Paracoccus sp. Z118]|uniref:FxsA family protein n=1 Tax=Paracoccus sp. Z118 TaxID=2851017 RepID=UPI001C2C970F|nr:FxsA family protein [Paracoccus sp. Z118]MBV0891241.1 FxsA family protein [Paracoccus sp. Z118]